MKRGEVFKGKSGKTFRYLGPDGGNPTPADPSTYEEIVVPEPYQMKQPEYEDPSLLASIGRGFADIGQGVQQIGRRMFGNPEETAAWEAQKNAELRMYEQGQGEGFDVGRLIGNIAGSAPLMAIPGGATAGVATRVGLGAAGGALGGAVNYTPTDNQSFAEWKTLQTGIGAIAGGALNAAAPAIARGIGAVRRQVARIPRSLGITTNDDIVIQLVNQAASKGIDLNRVPATVRQSFIADAMDQLNATGSIDIDSIARRQNLERWGFKGTVGQVTRDPKQWTRERNLMQIEDIGDPIRDRLVAQNQQMMTQAEGLAGRFSQAVPEQQVGLDVRRIADTAARASQKTVGEAYTRAANTPGIGDTVTDVARLRDGLTEVYDAFSDAIPGGIKDRVAALVDGRISPTVEQINNASKLVNRRLEAAANPAEKAGLSQVAALLRQQLDDAASAGGESAKALREASALAAKRFGFLRGKGLDESQLIDKLSDGGRADNLVNRLMTGDIDDLAHLRRFLNEFPESDFPNIPKSEMKTAWDNIRGAVVRKMNEKARYGDPAENAFSGFQLQKAWEGLGETRQSILFSPEERETINSFIDAVTAMTKAPPFETSNKSGTSGALINFGKSMMGKLRAIPGMGPMVEGLMSVAELGKQGAIKVSDRRTVNLALQGKPYTEQQRRALESGVRGTMERAGALPAAVAGATVSNNALNPSRKPRDKQAE